MAWKQIKLGDLFEQYRVQHIVQDNRDYGQITISKNGYIKFRATKNGKTIGRKRQFILDLQQYPNTLLFTRQGVSEGAIAFAPKDVDGCIATENMPMFSLKEGIDRKFVELLLKSEQYRNEVKKLIPTGSAQKSIHERDLMQILLLVPSEDEQKKLSEIIDNRLNNIQVLDTEIKTQQTLLKKLRQSILQEAIEGKLTASWREQNPDVESASILLEKIKTEKEQLIKDKKIKKQKPFPIINEDGVPFDIPDSWEWCRLGSVFNTTSGGTPARGNTTYWNGNISWLKSGEMTDGLITKISGEKITELGLNKSSATLFPNDTILIAMYGATAGKLGILTFPSSTNQAVCGFYKNNFIPKEYLFYFLKAQRSKILEDSWGQSQPNISQTYLKEISFPLAPLEEQKEIAIKIENLFKICDELEIQINNSKTNSQILMQAVLKEAFESE